MLRTDALAALRMADFFKLMRKLQAWCHKKTRKAALRVGWVAAVVTPQQAEGARLTGLRRRFRTIV